VCHFRRESARGLKVVLQLGAGSLILALGANLPGRWGTPREALRRVVQELAEVGLRPMAASRIYATTPIGPGRQAPYLNAVLILESHIAPAALLRLLKRLERCAGRQRWGGRRFGPLWGARCLDIDILDYAGRRIGAPSRRRERGGLVLPHPELHRRAFVLVPLVEVAPGWRHPVLGVTGRALLARLDRHKRAGVRQTLDSAAAACDKSAT
jgi:2-amino-4-hydroxy-6-hydroxymethyldihydropteridine diphosphokinase